MPASLLPEQPSFMEWLYLQCGPVYFALLVVSFFVGAFWASFVLMMYRTRLGVRSLFAVSMLPLLIGIFGTLEAFANYDKWSQELIDAGQEMTSEEESQWTQAAWVTTFVGSVATTPLLASAIIAWMLQRARGPKAPTSDKTKMETRANAGHPSRDRMAERSPGASSIKIVVCPACQTSVVPKRDGTCPACRATIAS